jgi:hypothetical protein
MKCRFNLSQTAQQTAQKNLISKVAHEAKGLAKLSFATLGACFTVYAMADLMYGPDESKILAYYDHMKSDVAYREYQKSVEAGVPEGLSDLEKMNYLLDQVNTELTLGYAGGRPKTFVGKLYDFYDKVTQKPSGSD